MEETAQTASIHGYDLFATTLTVSPHKDYKVIAAIGGKLAAIYNIGFLDMDFKKKAGFQRSIQLSKSTIYFDRTTADVNIPYRRK